MRSSLLIVLALACGQSASQGPVFTGAALPAWEVRPTFPPLQDSQPEGIALTVTELTVGERAIATVTGAEASARVEFGLGFATGDSVCPAALDGACLGIAEPVSALGAAPANAQGLAAIEFTVPEGFTGTAVFQAVSRGGRPLLTPAVALSIQAPSEPELAVGVTCGEVVCEADQVCCNASCGLCTAPGDSCIQTVCDDEE